MPPPAGDDADIGRLRSLGPRSAERLRNAGFDSIAALREAGAVVAYQRLRFLHGAEVSLNLLWALAAGLQDPDWRSLSEAEKIALRTALPPPR